MDLQKLVEDPLWQGYSGAVLWVVSLAGKWALGKFTRSAAAGHLRVLLPAVVAYLAVALYWGLGWPRPDHFALVALAVVLGFSIAELIPFWRTGLQGADVSIKKGLNYEKALGLCQNELCFLGIGAAKLTSQPNFRETIKRCARLEGGNLRFLLATPGSEFLQDAARQADERLDSYQLRVEDSLRTLARAFVDEGVRLEVRFYPDSAFIPLFRLMFIDDRLCLASYNAFGHGDGSDLPQIRVARKPDAQAHASFYYPFRRYFDALWQQAEPWRPEEFLKR